MPTCKLCSRAVLMLVYQRTQAIANPNSQQPPSTTEEVWHPGERLHPEQTKRCWICAKFRSWLEMEHHDLHQKLDLKPVPMRFSVLGFMILRKRDAGGMITFDMELDIGLREEHQDGENLGGCQCSLFLAPIQAFPTNACIFPVRNTLRSKLALARKWIDQCQNKHTLCVQGNRSWYPTRLLHIDRRTMKVKLIISQTHSPAGPYVTLSHRWETVMRVKLQSSTMTEMLNEVVTSSLSQAFQDAIAIAHHLDMSYLWIDALCIKQDEDEVDWKIESQYMSNVYSNAFLNLSATGSSTGAESLLSESSIRSLEPSRVSAYDTNRKDYYLFDNQIWRNEVDDAPLNQRGWVFQERYLARRILHFWSRQLAWECHESEALEIFPEGLPELLIVQCMSKPRSYKPLRQSPTEHDRIETGKFINEYHRLVHNYSGCQLTQSGDKLVAFSGIAESLRESRKDFYVAGVWNRTLPFDLLWYRDEFEREDPSPREASQIAPSWSWASVNGSVDFPDVPATETEIYIKDWRFQPQTRSRKSDAHKTLIKLKGFLLPVKLEWEDDDVSGFQVLGYQFHTEERYILGGSSMELDGPEEGAQISNRNANIHWMPCFATKQGIHGLLVSRISRCAKFRRLGIVQVTLYNLVQTYKLGGDAEEPDPNMRMTRSKRRRLDQDDEEGNHNDSRVQSLFEAMKTMKRVRITLN